MQLIAELRRTRLHSVRDAGMQGGPFGSQPHQPILTTEHSQRSQVFDFSPEGEKPDGLENPRGTAENQPTAQLTSGPGQVSNQGYLGERRALYAQANHAGGRWFKSRSRKLFFVRPQIILLRRVRTDVKLV